MIYRFVYLGFMCREIVPIFWVGEQLEKQQVATDIWGKNNFI